MSQSADLVGAVGVVPTTSRRPVLASALVNERKSLSKVIRRLAEEGRNSYPPEVFMLRLGEVAELLIVYGSASDAEWLAKLVGSALDDVDLGAVSASTLFMLGTRLHDLVGASHPVLGKLIVSALRLARTTRDLDGYEAFPDGVKSPALVALAEGRAREIIGLELAILRDGFSDLALTADAAVELHQRAHRYGLDIDIAGVLEQAAEISGVEEVPDVGFSKRASTWREIEDTPQVIFSRFRLQ